MYRKRISRKLNYIKRKESLFIILVLAVLAVLPWRSWYRNLLSVTSNQEITNTITLEPGDVFGQKLQIPEHVDGPSYGIAAGSSLITLSDTELSQRLDDIKALGVSWVRFDIEWSNIQPKSSTQYDWSKYDKIVIAAAKRDINVLGIIDYTPAWARADNCKSAQCPPKDAAAYAKFAGVVAKRYKNLGVNHWEIWNEPNNSQFWEPSVSPQKYTELLKQAFTSIKSADSSATVITAGLSPQADDANNNKPLTFLKAMYDSGAKGYFDAVGDHPYTFPQPPSFDSLHAWNQMAASDNSLRNEMVFRGDGDKKIWITEFGAPTNGPTATAHMNNYSSVKNVWQVDYELQAYTLSEAIRLYKSYDWVGPFFWYSYKDAGTSTNTNENFFGLVDAAGNKKPAYQTYKSSIQQP